MHRRTKHSRESSGLVHEQLAPTCGAVGAAGRVRIVPRHYPKEFRDDVVAVARRGDAPIKQVAADFGIAEACL